MDWLGSRQLACCWLLEPWESGSLNSDYGFQSLVFIGDLDDGVALACTWHALSGVVVMSTWDQGTSSRCGHQYWISSA